MKEAKEKPPAREHTLLGVQWQLTSDGAWASPGTERVRKVTEAIRDCLRRGLCSTPVAAKLAGKLAFVCSGLFGKAGQALLRAVYKRQHSGPGGDAPLSAALRASFLLLLELLPRLRPRFVPTLTRALRYKAAVLYADAFLTLHDQRMCANQWARQGPPLHELRNLTNGWGAVFFGATGERACFRAQVPEPILRMACSSRDYIYWLSSASSTTSRPSAR